jgi:serine/threonine protein phosphatase PrpC
VNEKFNTSGATATIVIATGVPDGSAGGDILLTVANCGDSHAYLDTCAEIVRMNADHRCDSNKAERQVNDASNQSSIASHTFSPPSV